MPWSITIARIAGSEIRIHLTFLILLAWFAVSGYYDGGPGEALQTVLFVVAVFACVVLRELGHALVARTYGITTPDITLLPIGGLARLSRIPDNPVEEIAIAVAGPLVNVIIAIALIVLFHGHFDRAVLAALEDPHPAFVVRLVTVNVILVVFNLIPAFPMDGGRVLRALLAFRLGRRRATQLAARIGQALAFAFGFFGLISADAILVFIAIFIYLAAAGEAGEAGLREASRKAVVDRAMVRSFESLGTQATVDEAAEALIRTTQREFPVIDGGGRLRGFLSRDDMIRALKATGPGTPVLDVMTRDVPTVRAGQSLELAVRLMQETSAREVGVVGDDGRLVGYVSRENLAEFMMVDDAEAAASPPRGSRAAG